MLVARLRTLGALCIIYVQDMNINDMHVAISTGQRSVVSFA
jgi:hypothetical protein